MVDLGMKTTQWKVELLVEVTSFEGDEVDILQDHFGPGEDDGAVEVLTVSTMQIGETCSEG